jgi:hypothetical protein
MPKIFNRRSFIRRTALGVSLLGGISARAYGVDPYATGGGGPAIFFDGDGLIVHKNLDGGDTAQREGWYWFGVWIREHVLRNPWPVPRRLTFPEVLSLLEPHKDGVFYRHPKLPPWNNPFDKTFGFSRDQMTPLVAAMGVYGQTEALRRLWNALPEDPVGGTKHSFNGEWLTVLGKRVAYTGDIIGPATINLFRRAWNEDPNAAGDGNGQTGEAEISANVALRLDGVLKNRDDTGDDLNLIVMLLMAHIRYQTDISRKSTATYKNKRLYSYGSFVNAYKRQVGADLLNIGALPDDTREKLDAGIATGWSPDATRVFGVVRWYHRVGAGANPQLADLYEPIIRAYLV